MEKGIEREAFDVGNDCKTFYDCLGESYITEEDYVIFCQMNLKLKSYDVARCNSKEMKQRF